MMIMKNHIKLFLSSSILLILIVQLLGCSTLTAEVSEENELSNSNIVINSDVVDSLNSSPSCKIVSEIYMGETESSSFVIPYPQIVIDGGGEEEKNINKTLYHMGVETYTDDWDIYEIDADYSIGLLNEQIISVIFQGIITPTDGRYPSTACFAVTIDLDTGELIKLGDVIPLENLECFFTPQYFTLVEGIDSLEAGEANYKSLFDQYKEFPSFAYDCDHLHDFYIKEDCLGIIIGVPHIDGDIVVFEATYD